MTARRRIFVLGGTGFIGSAVTRQLTETRDENDLMMLIHRRAPLRQLEHINTYTGSLGGFDLAMLDRFAPDTIIHLARMSGRGRWGRHLAAWKGSRANHRIITYLRYQLRKPHVIYISGTLMYGDCGDLPVAEDSPVQPTAFAREYIRAERPWMDALNANSLPVTILRPPWIIGNKSWFETFYLTSIRTRNTVPLFGDGKNLMSLIDVEDCAGLIRHAVRHASPGRIYNLFAPGACITQLEFAEKLARCTGAKVTRFSREEIKRCYGQAVMESFLFSNRSATRHPEFLSGYRFKYPTVDQMIEHNLTTAASG